MVTHLIGSLFKIKYGGVAQLGEHLCCKQGYFVCGFESHRFHWTYVLLGPELDSIA